MPIQELKLQVVVLKLGIFGLLEDLLIVQQEQ